MRIMAILPTLALAGCNSGAIVDAPLDVPNARIAIVLDPTLTDRDVDTYHAAAAAWEQASCARVSFELARGDASDRAPRQTIHIRRATSHVGAPLAHTEWHGTAAAETDLYAPISLWIAAHELGHALGLEHEENARIDALMRPFEDVDGSIRSTDVARLRALWPCMKEKED